MIRSRFALILRVTTSEAGLDSGDLVAIWWGSYGNARNRQRPGRGKKTPEAFNMAVRLLGGEGFVLRHPNEDVYLHHMVEKYTLPAKNIHHSIAIGHLL
jgi:hypothetical protein